MQRFFEGSIEVGDGPVWRQGQRQIATAINPAAHRRPGEILVNLADGRIWTIRRVHGSGPEVAKRKLRELSGSRFELFGEGPDPAAWTEQLAPRAMRRALTDHVGVGLSWTDRWRLANATARSLPLMHDLVTPDDRFELRPRFEAVAYPAYPGPLSRSAPDSSATGIAQLLHKGRVVASGGLSQLRVQRPIPLEVALLTSYVISNQWSDSL